jgi:hypothetical protein
MRAHSKSGGPWALVVGALVAITAMAGGCGTDSSTPIGGGRTQTTTHRAAQIIDGHASVLPSSAAEGGGALACPADYKTCGDGGCCPAAGACTAGFTCEVAPTTCSACTSNATSGRCCEGNCCPNGSTCNNGVCRTKRAEAPVTCDDIATAKCGDGCCPAGAACNGDVCEIHAGTPPVCADGATLCDNGTCCPAGYACGTTSGSSRCEKVPDAPSVGSVSGTCGTGEVVILPKGTNCPAVTSSNSSYLRATCCPTGSSLYCRTPSSTFDPEPTCLVTPTDTSGSCPSGSIEVSSGSIYKCCPYTNSYPYLSDIDGDGSLDCYYTSTYAPTCSSGSIDPTTGKCCSGTSAGSGGCCPSGSSVCGTGCCSSTDSCVSGKCTAYTTTAPTCPTSAARRCSQSDGSSICCPLDTTCGPNGTCSCPLSANVDCGGFCATDSAACGCPSDHPDLCGGSCCLAGGCSQTGVSSQTGTCGCPGSAVRCGADVCCPQGTTCSTSLGGCYKCPEDASTLCGKNCCSKTEQCVDGECVGCPVSAPNACGKTCCTDNETCSDGVCKRSSGSAGSSSSGGSTGSSGTTCSSYTSACAGCSYRVCVTNASSSSSCRSYYETSTGARYTCAACGDCSSAAQSVVSSCCSSQ